jgi:hypothetical protein
MPVAIIAPGRRRASPTIIHGDCSAAAEAGTVGPGAGRSEGLLSASDGRGRAIAESKQKSGQRAAAWSWCRLTETRTPSL